MKSSYSVVSLVVPRMEEQISLPLLLFGNGNFKWQFGDENSDSPNFMMNSSPAGIGYIYGVLGTTI